jgi:hypothetical protein
MKFDFTARKGNRDGILHMDITVDDKLTIRGATVFIERGKPPKLVLPTKVLPSGDTIAVIRLAPSLQGELQAALEAHMEGGR